MIPVEDRIEFIIGQHIPPQCMNVPFKENISLLLSKVTPHKMECLLMVYDFSQPFVQLGTLIRD